MSTLANVRKHIFISASLFMLIFGLSACTGHQINLDYNTVGPSMGTESGLPTVMVAEFKSNLPQAAIGADSDGEPYTAGSSPTAWISEALADELVRLGVRASYSPYLSSNYVIQGSLDHFWVEQTGAAQYQVKISITAQLPQDKNGVTLRKTYNAEQSSLILPTDAKLSSLIESTVRDMLISAAQDIKNNLPRN